MGCDLQNDNRYSNSSSISIHAAQMGCDICLIAAVQCLYIISIHAAQMGCDTPFSQYFQPRSAFQSTQPKWAATTPALTDTTLVSISIHAAQMGCDCQW